MNLFLDVFNNIPSLIVTLILIALIYGSLLYLFYSTVKRAISYISLAVSFVLVLLTYLFSFFEALIIVVGFSTAVFSIILFINANNVRSLFAAPFKRSQVKSNKNTVTKIYDRQEFYKVINNTVLQFSKSKTGALMTFEKNDDITSLTRNGVLVDAPVSQELLSTIFFPGTRLHDGAVIIRGNMIKYASVFYTPSTQAYTGKYGSRHRAAIGISEMCDAITVVVSEETGRISIAVGGQIESISGDDFLNAFENYMLTDEDKKLEVYE